MVKSLLKGIGDTKKVEKFYDDWSKNYEQSLIDWNYKAPRQSVNILNKYIKTRNERIINICPASTPKLKPIKAGINLSCINPIEDKFPANPKPCTSPNNIVTININF